MTFLEDVILSNSCSTMPLKIVVNNKFYVQLAPNDFHKSTSRAILRNYMFLTVLEERIEYRPSYKIKKYYVESEELERDLIDFENKWYDKNKKKVEEIINEYEV
jgi:hypothetical protein